MTLHSQGKVTDNLGREIYRTSEASGIWVARFDLADGGVRAIGIGYVGIRESGLSIIDYGWH